MSGTVAEAERLIADFGIAQKSAMTPSVLFDAVDVRRHWAVQVEWPDASSIDRQRVDGMLIKYRVDARSYKMGQLRRTLAELTEAGSIRVVYYARCK